MKVILNTPKKPKAKKIPMYKDPVYIAKVRREFIEAHNKRIQKKKEQERKNNV